MILLSSLASRSSLPPILQYATAEGGGLEILLYAMNSYIAPGVDVLNVSFFLFPCMCLLLYAMMSDRQ